MLDNSKYELNSFDSHNDYINPRIRCEYGYLKSFKYVEPRGEYVGEPQLRNRCLGDRNIRSKKVAQGGKLGEIRIQVVD